MSDQGRDTVSFETVSPTSEAAQFAMGAYFAELDERFSTGFDRVDGGADNDAAAMSPPGGAFVIARRHQGGPRGDAAGSGGPVVGCGGVIRLDVPAASPTAEIKRMWVAGDARGLGLGKRLLAELEAVAVGLRCERVVLDTNAALTEAIAMYERCGYVAIDRYNDNPYADHWFAKALAT